MLVRQIATAEDGARRQLIQTHVHIVLQSLFARETRDAVVPTGYGVLLEKLKLIPI